MAHRLEGLSRRGEAADTPPAGVTPGVGHAIDMPRRAVWKAVAASAVVIVALVSLAWLWPVPVHVAPRPTPEGERLFTVVPTALTSRLTMTGTVGAGKTVAVLAPFDGIVRERRVQLGDHVVAGDTLLVMDAGEIQGRFREARAALLKAAMVAEALDRWDTSPDVMRARRTLEAAESSLVILERQAAETRTLLDRGIVSRNEYDSLVQQRDMQRASAASGRQDLQATLERGSTDNRRLADLDLANARARLTDLQQQVDGAMVVAAAAGILARPPATSPSGQSPAVIDPGSRVARGQPLFTIADTATLVVAGKVDEMDVNRVRVGQPVSITSDAFPGRPITGRVVSVSAEASGDQGMRAPSFDVRAAFFDEDAARQQLIRIGMSARMTIETRSSPAAIVVPVEAVRGAPSAPTVTVRDMASGADQKRAVVLGDPTERGIEIVGGLEPGAVVVIP